MDWGLKTYIKFCSRKSFDWTCADDAKLARALQSHLRQESLIAADPSDRFQNALHYWSHPSGPLPPAMTAVLKKQARTY